MLQRLQVLDACLVAAEDLGSGTKVVGELLPIPLPHFPVAAQSVDLLVEGHIVGRPIACSRQESAMNSANTCKRETMEQLKKRRVVTSPQSLGLVRILHQTRDLLHHHQGAVIDAAAQFHFASVQDHVLVVVCAYNRERKDLECGRARARGHDDANPSPELYFEKVCAHSSPLWAKL